MTRTRRVMRGLGVSYVSQVVLALVGLWVTPFLLGRLGQEQYGLWLVATQLLAYLALTDLGIVALLPREVAAMRQMTSAGAMGGGVSSAIARALGSGDAAARAQAGGARARHRSRDGRGVHRLDSVAGRIDLPPARAAAAKRWAHALRYSNIVFGGAIAVWVANTLSSVLRGSGNMLAPALTLISAAAAFTCRFRRRSSGRIGIAGAGIAYVTTFGIAALVMAAIVFRRSSPLRPQREDWRARMAPVPRDPARRRDLDAVSRCRPCSPP